MTDQELAIYRQLILYIDGGTTAEQLKWWAAARILHASLDKDVPPVTARPTKLPA